MKPIKKNLEFFDHLQCKEYLIKKYNYNPLDYHKVFWEWMNERENISNGCYIRLSREELKEIKEYNEKDLDLVFKIYENYLDEFADEKGELTLNVWW